MYRSCPFAGKENKMDQQQNMELTKDQIIQELIALFKPESAEGSGKQCV